MTARERFHRVFNFEKPDRLPMIEWAAWWDLTIDRWQGEGLPEMDVPDSLDYFGLDKLIMLSARCDEGIERPAVHGAPVIENEAGYEALRPRMYTDHAIQVAVDKALALKARHDSGEMILRLWLDGFFWFPRKMLGIEPHLYAFYDQPELMHRINADLTDFNLRLVEALFSTVKPDLVGFAEDMSYNHGPMLSHETFREFLLPYYRRLVPVIKKHGVKVLVDSDGDVGTMVPWLLEAGIEGAYPLERQAGVDIAAIRAQYPQFLMLGGYNKLVMHLGEAAIREEFERLLPVMRSGGYIPSVDHQTPPQVSLEDYRLYVRLLAEYCRRAAE